MIKRYLKYSFLKKKKKSQKVEFEKNIEGVT